MKALIVSVEYGDILNITLPVNRHHFTDVLVVTTKEDKETQEAADRHKAWVHCTDSFYSNGAIFNKYLPMEEGLDILGREGLMCFLDADVIWPDEIGSFKKDCLCTPIRRIVPNPFKWKPQDSWNMYKVYKDREWAGYTQIFHADDPVLGERPWLEHDWGYAAGGDSSFQRKWNPANKVRPSWQCLHLGKPRDNWCGRVSPYQDGTVSEKVEERTRSFQLIHRYHQQYKVGDSLEEIQRPRIRRNRRG